MESALLTHIAAKGSEAAPKPLAKISVLGAAGQVGLACAVSLIYQGGAATEVCMVDCVADRLAGEGKDLQQSLCFVPNAPKVTYTTDYAETRDSKIIVITAGVRQQPGESRLSLVQRNVNIFKSFVPILAKNSPDAIFLVASNPCDIMAYVTWKLSGFPINRVISTGTNLDTGRFRVFLSERLGVHPNSVHGWIVGEHGDSSVPVWSGVNVAGLRLKDANEKFGTSEDPEKLNELGTQVVRAAYEIIELKGYTNWAIGASVAQICSAVLKNRKQVLAVGTLTKGHHEIKEDVFMSLPCILGSNGIESVVNIKLDKDETAKMNQSAKTIFEAQSTIQW